MYLPDSYQLNLYICKKHFKVQSKTKVYSSKPNEINGLGKVALQCLLMQTETNPTLEVHFTVLKNMRVMKQCFFGRAAG